LKPTVVTGQQIGLLGGPMYTTCKVLGAARYAREIGGRAVYWLASNDADFAEINHIDYLDAHGKLRHLEWDINSGGYSCGLIPVDDALTALLNTFFDAIRQTEFTDGLRSLALGCYRPGRTLGEASRELAQRLYGRFGVEVFDPTDAEFRRFTQPYLRREAERTPVGEQCNLFCMNGRRREAVFRDAAGFHLRDGSRVDIDTCELVPNVKTRNVMQDAWFNTHTYIAGPGEVRYIAELDGEYEFHRVRKAAVKPRMSVTLVEPKTRRLLKKTGLTIQQVCSAGKAELRRQVLAQHTGLDLRELARQADEAVQECLDRLDRLGLDAGAIGKALRDAVKAAVGSERARQKRRHQQLLEDTEELSDRLHPLDRKQERVFNVFYYMNLHGGPAFVDRLYEQYDFNATVIEI